MFLFCLFDSLTISFSAFFSFFNLLFFSFLFFFFFSFFSFVDFQLSWEFMIIWYLLIHQIWRNDSKNTNFVYHLSMLMKSTRHQSCFFDVDRRQYHWNVRHVYDLICINNSNKIVLFEWKHICFIRYWIKYHLMSKIVTNKFNVHVDDFTKNTAIFIYLMIEMIDMKLITKHKKRHIDLLRLQNTRFKIKLKKYLLTKKHCDHIKICDDVKWKLSLQKKKNSSSCLWLNDIQIEKNWEFMRRLSCWIQKWCEAIFNNKNENQIRE